MKQSKLPAAAVLLLAAVLGTGAVLAQAPIKDKEYALVEPPQPTNSGGKVEVIEFFFYGCPHCYNLQPTLMKWQKTMPKDVDFKRIPTIFRDTWVPMARAFYAMEAAGVLDKLHHDLFIAIHEQRNERLLNDKAAFLDWAAAKGANRKKLEDAYDSFAVQTKTQRAVQLTKLYGITGTPSVVVDGKYLTAPGMTLNANHEVDYDRFTKVLNELIAGARKEHAAKKG